MSPLRARWSAGPRALRQAPKESRKALLFNRMHWSKVTGYTVITRCIPLYPDPDGPMLIELREKVCGQDSRYLLVCYAY
jgi:hypothetical protein